MEVSIYTSSYKATVQLRGLFMLFRPILEETQVNRRCEAMDVAVVGKQSVSYPDSNSAWI